MDSDTITLAENKSVETIGGTYSFTISPHIHERLERHILILKKLIDRSTTKQRWMIDAIKEKFANDANKQEIPKAHTLNVKIDEELDKQLLNRVDFIRKFRFSYSKKQWLVDAVLEKLERDEKEVEKKIMDIQQTKAETYKQQVEKLQAELAALKNQLSKYQS